jgi:hypothetical protein
MNARCVRCLVDDMQSNFCPQCGTALAVRRHTPSIVELETLEAELTAFLPRLRRIAVCSILDSN